MGLALGLAGVSLAVGGSLGGASFPAYVLSAASTLSLVTATIVAKAMPDSTPLLPSLAIQSIVAALLFAPLALLEGGMAPVLDRSVPPHRGGLGLRFGLGDAKGRWRAGHSWSDVNPHL